MEPKSVQIDYASRFFPTARIRKKATMLAMTTATTPPAEPAPMSLLRIPVRKTRKAMLVEA
ncbi:hypothetical protein D3C72_2519340 [compost metagenome]